MKKVLLEKIYKSAYMRVSPYFYNKAHMLAAGHLVAEPGTTLSPLIYDRIVKETAMFMQIGARLKRNKYVFLGALAGGVVVYLIMKGDDNYVIKRFKK